jgi:uncharacterized phage protein gp47/JayE
MAYQAPSIGAAGLSIPTYRDILEDLMASFKSIYGQDVYLGEDSADYQFISILALKIHDCVQTLQLAYNSSSPKTAVGAALESIVKLNGLKRKVASYSTCTVTLTGTPGTVITNGVVSDVAGNKWSLPSTVTIGPGGTISVTATCQVIGSIAALPGDITSISTPTSGWISVNNISPATLGQPVETEAELKARQSVSVALPSRTMLTGTIAALASVPGVLRHKVYENATDSIDSWGHPRHSITPVVEGGHDYDVAMAIYLNKGIGCMTNGTSAEMVVDPITNIELPIRFYRPSYVPIYVTLNLTALQGYTSAVESAIKQAVAAHLNSLGISDRVTVSSITAAALSLTDLKKPSFSVKSNKIAKTASPTLSNDILLNFDEVSQGDVAKVVITYL